MARGKKKKLSLEELLEEALVKEEEKPYEVPENWIWTRFSQILDVRDGTHNTPKYVKKGIPLITSKNLINGSLDYSKIKYISLEDHEIISKRSAVSNEDILFAMIGTIGNPVIVKKTQEFSIKNVALFKKISQIDIPSKYIYYYLQYAQEDMKKNASGGLQPFVSLTFLRNYKISIAPLPEQQRIVDTIESLFKKLDKAKELVQNVLDSFENRKAAILHKAFTGELTAKWREENGVSLDEWEEKKLGELIKSGPQNGLYKPKTAYGKGYKIVRIDNFYEGVINPWNTLKKLALEEKEIEIYGLRNNDILINRVNSMQYLGKSALVRNLDDICVFESNVMRMSLLENVVPEYIIKYLNSAQGLEELRKNAKHAVNQASINQTDVKNAIMVLPHKKEQQEIVRIINNIIENEQRAKYLCDVIVKIDLMKKAILSCTFRGELGTNKPEEESAVELLKQVINEKIKETSNNIKKETKKTIKSKISKKKRINENKQDLLIQILIKEKNSITPERLFELANMDDRYEFYSELKALIESGQVKEIKEKKTSISLLEVVK